MIRITGGVHCGRLIQTPRNENTRPTQAKLRQALFNSLQAHLPEARVLDLFAGSGSLGFEAISRGAQHAVFVEQSRPVVQLIQKNAETLRVENQIQIFTESVQTVLSRLKKFQPFDLIMADPPYSEDWETKLLETWPWGELLSPGGIFCLEWGAKKSVVSELPEKIPFLVKVREKNYGDSMLTTYAREENDS